MNNNDIKNALAALSETMYLLEEEYIENGGEVTVHTTAMEANIERLRILLTTEGVDSLGRWLKSKEDQMKALKAEQDSVKRQIKSCENTIDYIKTMVNMVLTSTGQEKVKGTFYSFATSISRKTEVDKEILEQKYRGIVAEVDGKLPPWVSVRLSASVSAIPTDWELGMPEEFVCTETPSVKFTKPRASKEV